MIFTYNSIAALRQDYIKQCSTKCDQIEQPSSWYGGETAAQTLHFTEVGNTRLVPDAELLLAKLNTHIETPHKVWHRYPAGAFCVVPEYLAGLPTPMRRQIHTYEETAPITIFVTTTSSGAINASVLAKRGTVILALVLALTRVRPVALHQLTCLDGKDGETVITAQINTNPLDLATACYVLTSAGFARRITYDLARKLNKFGGGWPKAMLYNNPEPYFNDLKSRLVSNPSKCLILPGARLDDELLTNPVQWVQSHIDAFTKTREEDS